MLFSHTNHLIIDVLYKKIIIFDIVIRNHTSKNYLVYYHLINYTKMLDFLNPIFGRHPERIKAKVEIYTWQTCPYCIRAKLLLWWKGVNYIEYKIDGNELARNSMTERANGNRTLPQIFINDQHIGGCDDIYALDSKGELDPLFSQTV